MSDHPVVMVTGHRVVSHPDAAGSELERVLVKLGASRAISGGAAGADRLFAETALRVGVPVHLMLPNRYYRARYPGSVDDDLIGRCRCTFVVDRPDVDDWQLRWRKEKWWEDNFTRNRAMIDLSDVTIVVSDLSPRRLLGEARSGTAGTVRDVLRARGEGHKVIWIPPATIATGGLGARWVPLRIADALGDWSDHA